MVVVHNNSNIFNKRHNYYKKYQSYWNANKTNCLKHFGDNFWILLTQCKICIFLIAIHFSSKSAVWLRVPWRHDVNSLNNLSRRNASDNSYSVGTAYRSNCLTRWVERRNRGVEKRIKGGEDSNPEMEEMGSGWRWETAMARARKRGCAQHTYTCYWLFYIPGNKYSFLFFCKTDKCFFIGNTRICII